MYTLLCRNKLCIPIVYLPPKKLLGRGLSTPYTPFRWICTISPDLKCISHLHPLEWAGVEIRCVSVDGFDTCWVWSGFLCGISCMYIYVVFIHIVYWYVHICCIYTYVYSTVSCIYIYVVCIHVMYWCVYISCIYYIYV